MAIVQDAAQRAKVLQPDRCGDESAKDTAWTRWVVMDRRYTADHISACNL